MGVDLSYTSVVGFTIPKASEDKLAEVVGTDPEDGFTEAAYCLSDKFPLLEAGVAGSYYDNGEKNVAWVGVSRLTETEDIWDIPGGIYNDQDFEGAVPDLTEEERSQLNEVWAGLSDDELKVKSFTAILWH